MSELDGVSDNGLDTDNSEEVELDAEAEEIGLDDELSEDEELAEVSLDEILDSRDIVDDVPDSTEGIVESAEWDDGTLTDVDLADLRD